jgi:beta-glucosidase/6-phospho-beta-glucosidase/beta-galactosidase
MSAGVPVRGFTWYSLTDQIDWQHALRHEYNELHPVGLYDLDRRIRPVGEAYRRMINDHRHLMTGNAPSRSMDIVA